MSAARVVLHPRVAKDIADIIDYIAARNAAAAQRMVTAIQQTLEFLAAMPGIGSPKDYSEPELQGMRIWFVRGFRNYLIAYKPLPDGIEVLAILHGARSIGSIMRQRAGPE